MLFITEAYRDKVNIDNGRDNCRFEFQHAFEKKGPELMIPVVMEPCMRNVGDWTGVLGAALSAHLYIDFSTAFTDDAIFDAKVKELVRSIGCVAAMKRPPSSMHNYDYMYKYNKYRSSTHIGLCSTNTQFMIAERLTLTRESQGEKGTSKSNRINFVAAGTV